MMQIKTEGTGSFNLISKSPVLLSFAYYTLKMGCFEDDPKDLKVECNQQKCIMHIISRLLTCIYFSAKLGIETLVSFIANEPVLHGPLLHLFQGSLNILSTFSVNFCFCLFFD